MKLKLLFFGSLVDVTGIQKKELSTDSLLDVKLLNEHLHAVFPLLIKHKYKIAVNQKIVDNSQTLQDGDEVAFLPPFAGG
jgi:molybdopterin converting factor subunit 1